MAIVKMLLDKLRGNVCVTLGRQNIAIGKKQSDVELQ